jgi:hypothetical protein
VAADDNQLLLQVTINSDVLQPRLFEHQYPGLSTLAIFALVTRPPWSTFLLHPVVRIFSMKKYLRAHDRKEKKQSYPRNFI